MSTDALPHPYSKRTSRKIDEGEDSSDEEVKQYCETAIPGLVRDERASIVPSCIEDCSLREESDLLYLCKF